VKGGIEPVPKATRFTLIHEMAERYPIRLLCSLAGVSPAGYYKWMKRQSAVTDKQREDGQLKEKLVEGYRKTKGIYGYRRRKVWLKKKYDIHVNHKRVQRLMKELGIKAGRYP
jgi:putative transposase